MKKRKNRRSPVSAICSALGTLLLIFLIAICIPMTVPRFFGYQMFTVVSGSMEPQIPVGSLVCIKETEPQDIQSGDVIAFWGFRDSNTIITHRVVENRVIMGELITKGDANQTNDMNPVRYDNLIGRVEFHIPHLGTAAQLLTSVEGKIAAAGVIGLAVVFIAISMLLDGNVDYRK